MLTLLIVMNRPCKQGQGSASADASSNASGVKIQIKYRGIKIWIDRFENVE